MAITIADGTLLRGEVLARWQDLVGTGELLRGLERQVSRLRDRLGAALRGRPAPAAQAEEAIESSVVRLLVSQLGQAALETDRAWRRAGSAPAAVEELSTVLPTSEELSERAGALVRDWQAGVLEMVRAEGSSRRLTARVLSFGVGAVGVALMVVVFAHTGGLSGGEVGIAGGTALVAQRLLEAVFGDQAMRTMAARAYEDLLARTEELAQEHSQAVLGTLPRPVPASAQLRQDVERLRSRLEEQR